jgi:GNAT acetyltransferase-like protein/glutathione-dependent formaldehyde-activating enzyme
MLTGGCLCGAIRFEVNGPVGAATYYHCSMCRKSHGTAFRARLSVPKSSFRFTQGQQFLASRAWGCGYMYEALSALLDYGFTELNLNRVEADTDPRNERSTRLLARLQFFREGLFRERCIVDGEISDAAMYGLLRRDWAEHRRSEAERGDHGHA